MGGAHGFVVSYMRARTVAPRPPKSDNARTTRIAEWRRRTHREWHEEAVVVQRLSQARRTSA